MIMTRLEYHCYLDTGISAITLRLEVSNLHFVRLHLLTLRFHSVEDARLPSSLTDSH
jgi:hypothetical protein